MLRRSNLLTAGLTVYTACMTRSAEARLPGTLNFRNITATNVHQTVPELAQNEKEVDFGDFDNDGDLDVAVGVAHSDFGQRRNKLYQNVAGEFNEISGTAAIPGFAGTDVTRNVFFRDYNRDGWLDMIVVNDANTGGDGGRTKLYINKQIAGHFNRFDEEGNTRLGPDTGGAACGGFSADFNGDGNIDLYVGNYPGPPQDTMYFNNAAGFFTSMTSPNVPVEGDYTVDVASADMNGDGKLDLLISNHVNNYVYYNNLNNAGSGLGDFSYPNSTQLLADAAISENAMEPGDFNNDGRMDIYWSNRYAAAQGTSRIYQNFGNNAQGQAAFMELAATILPPSVRSFECRKATVADLNQDGRQDILVMKEGFSNSNNRPTILRNTTVNNTTSFVDWTPAAAMPDGQTHTAWHAAAFDADGDGWKDIFLGGWTNDHLFKNVDSTEVDEADLGGTINNILNQDPLAIVGEVGDPPDDYVVNGVLAGDMVSLVLHSECADVILRVLNQNLGVIAQSDRGGIGAEEALQIAVPVGAAPIHVQVLIRTACGDADADGHIDLDDYDALLDCNTGPGGTLTHECTTLDFDDDDDIDFADFAAWQDAFTGPVAFPTAAYVLEILARD